MAEVKAERSAVPGCISQGLECQAKELKLHSVGHRKPLKIFFFLAALGLAVHGLSLVAASGIGRAHV